MLYLYCSACNKHYQMKTKKHMKTSLIKTLEAGIIIGAILFLSPACQAAKGKEYDLVVYGQTSAGVMAAVQAKRMDKTVILVGPDKSLGGLSSGGLGATDIGNKRAIGGLSREFYQRLGKHYGKAEMWIFEPHVAEKIFEDYVAEHKITVHRDEWLDRTPGKGVEMKDGRIVSITMLSGKTYCGKMFIDATYEGDLMAAAGVSYTFGREANSEYGETLNGVQTQQVDITSSPRRSTHMFSPAIRRVGCCRA